MSSDIYLLIRNIPRSLHSKDLRLFFSEFVETNKFTCFHFLHRSESDLKCLGDLKLDTPISDSKDICCCVVKLKFTHSNLLHSQYNNKRWNLDPLVCKIQRFPRDKDIDFSKLPELHPPPVMPQGNVGTPTSFFLAEIKQCKLPTSLISKLGLQFPKATGRKYAQVSFSYDLGHSDQEDDCEEFERAEAFLDDPSNQERLAERMFEEPLEVVWEKGGSGLVFYTDAQYWDEAAGDFDDKTADDVDVDMNVYYEGWEAGDVDARQRIEMAESTRLAAGAFNEKRDAVPPNMRRANNREQQIRGRSRSPVQSTSSIDVGKVEGIGNNLLRRAGWKPGQGLGRRNQGISEPIEADGQGPRDRTGIGFRGGKIDLKAVVAAAKQAAEAKRGPRLIATVYDGPSSSKDPGLYRRCDHYELRTNKDSPVPSSEAKMYGSTGTSSTDYR